MVEFTRQKIVMLTPDLRNVHLGGELSRRVEMALRRLLREDEFPIREGFTARPYMLNYLLADLLGLSDEGSPCGHWAGDESGRYINVLSYIAPYAGNIYPRELKQNLMQKLKDVVEGILPLQRQEGYFGKKELEEGKIYRDQISGQGWLLRGLVEYYKLTRDEKAILSAKKLGDYYIKTHLLWTTPEAMIDMEQGKCAYVYSNYTHCIDGLVNLWRVTKEEKYLDLAKKIGKLVKTFEHSIHSHHFFSTLRGLINLYLATGDKFYLNKVEAEWDEISTKGILPTGGVPECYTNWTSDEGCSEADWAMINLYLWSITQKPRYIEMAEKIILNHFYWNQCSNGGFSGNYGGGDFRLGKMGNLTPGKRTEAYWCCSMHCTFALAEIARHIFTYNEKTLYVNLFNNVHSTFRMGDSEVKLEIETLYPLKGFVKIEVESKNLFDLKIRVPIWIKQENITLLVNEKQEKCNVKDSYLQIPKKGRRLKIELSFPFLLRIEGSGEKHAIFYGPSILRPINKIDDSEIIILPDQPDYKVENGLLQLTLFGVKFSEDIEKGDKWSPRLFEPISQEPFHPLDITSFLFEANLV